MRRSVSFVTALAFAALALTACTIVNPYPPVPPLQAETMPLPPVTVTPLIWRPGHWDWNGADYVWQPGAYIPRIEGQSDQWLPGHWAVVGGSWGWQPAHWL